MVFFDTCLAKDLRIQEKIDANTVFEHPGEIIHRTGMAAIGGI
jgi:hypothetical protein